MKKIVVPGEQIETSAKVLGDHVYKVNDKIYSDSLGIVSDSTSRVEVVPLAGCYIPKMNDFIIGVIIEERPNGYIMDVNGAYPVFINKKDLRNDLKIKTIASAKVFKINEVGEISVSEVREFLGGDILTVSPVKVPRIIGKNESMLKILKDNTQMSIYVGKNGYLWIKGENSEKLISAIEMIASLAHTSNLTNKIEAYLKGDSIVS